MSFVVHTLKHVSTYFFCVSTSIIWGWIKGGLGTRRLMTAIVSVLKWMKNPRHILVN